MDRRRTKSFFNFTSFPLKNRLALTTGDPDGIGKKVVVKSLSKLGPKKNFQFLVWTDKQAKTLKIPSFKTFVFHDANSSLTQNFKENHIFQIKASGGPGDHLETAARLCLEKKVSALITGPASKALIKKHRLKALSQTALLKTLLQKQNLFMCFRGQFFNTILFTDHIPLQKISIPKQKFKNFLSLALESRIFLPSSLQKKPLGILGLNPHSGEGGLIGKEEQKILHPIIKEFSSKNVQGPLVPDAAFLKKNWSLYSFFIALYHDQGLIPFKIIHSHKGFAQTLGLPFLRLGVDHGTGLGLKDKDISEHSFLAALKEALKLIKARRNLN